MAARHEDEQAEGQRPLHYTLTVNYVPPQEVACYRGRIVRYAWEREKEEPVLAGGPGVWPPHVRWEKRTVIETAETHIAEIDDGSAHPQLLLNMDYRSSPAGFCWGYGGSGPHALALSLLAHHLGEWPRKDAFYGGMLHSRLMHADLVRDMVSQWPMEEDWTLPREKLAAWVRAWKASHADELADLEREKGLWEEEQRELDALEAEEEQEARS